jgi:hypothetical protein
MTSSPLTIERAQSYQRVINTPFCFVAVTGAHKYQGHLGIARANERGYNPIPMGWARYVTFAEAEAHADLLNSQTLGLTNEDSTFIIISTMGGIRYDRP